MHYDINNNDQRLRVKIMSMMMVIASVGTTIVIRMGKHYKNNR